VEINNSNGYTNVSSIKEACLFADFPFEDIPDTVEEAYQRFEKACSLAFPGHSENIGAAYADFLQIIAI
jgi:orotidine-5'-phosphate decarboxylase